MLPGALWLLDLPEDKPRGIELFLEAEERLRLRLCPVQMPFTKNTEVAVADICFSLNTNFQRLPAITWYLLWEQALYHMSVSRVGNPRNILHRRYEHRNSEFLVTLITQSLSIVCPHRVHKYNPSSIMQNKDRWCTIVGYREITSGQKDQGIMEWIGLERTSEITNFQLPAMGRDAIHEIRAPSSLALNTSRDGTSTTSLDSLFQRLHTWARPVTTFTICTLTIYLRNTQAWWFFYFLVRDYMI